MGRIVALVFGVLLGGSTVFAAFHLHLVRAEDTLLVVPKRQATWKDAYVDIRHWRVKDWNEHGELAKNMIACGHGHRVVRASGQGVLQSLQELFEPRATETKPKTRQPGPAAERQREALHK